MSSKVSRDKAASFKANYKEIKVFGHAECVDTSFSDNQVFLWTYRIEQAMSDQSILLNQLVVDWLS